MNDLVLLLKCSIESRSDNAGQHCILRKIPLHCGIHKAVIASRTSTSPPWPGESASLA